MRLTPKSTAKSTSEIVLAVAGPRITKEFVEITNAEPAEADILTSIAFAAKRHWGYPEHWIVQWKSLLTITPESVANHETFAARAGGRVLGFGALKLDDEKLHLKDLWVWPAEMGRGVGRALFRHAQWRARERGFSWLEIESDPHAVHFYTHMGADVIGEHVTSLEGQPRRLPVLRCLVCPVRAFVSGSLVLVTKLWLGNAIDCEAPASSPQPPTPEAGASPTGACPSRSLGTRGKWSRRNES